VTVSGANVTSLNFTATALPPSVSLSWTASVSTNVMGYNMYRATVSGGPYTLMNNALIPGTSYADNTVVAGQTYYYVTTAVDSSNNQSAYSNEAVAAVAGAPHRVSLSWTGSTSPNISGYHVYRGTVSGGPYALTSTALVSGTSYADNTVVAGQTYYYVTTE
jgi:fibronectin type 3 domain-containing protein